MSPINTPSSCNSANAFGMKLVLPVLKSYNAPYLLVHCKIPSDEKAEEQRQAFLQNAYDAVCSADETYADRTSLDDPNGEHHPFELPERPELAHVSTLQELHDVYPTVKSDYEALAAEIMRRLP